MDICSAYYGRLYASHTASVEDEVAATQAMSHIEELLMGMKTQLMAPLSMAELDAALAGMVT